MLKDSKSLRNSITKRIKQGLDNLGLTGWELTINFKKPAKKPKTLATAWWNLEYHRVTFTFYIAAHKSVAELYDTIQHELLHYYSAFLEKDSPYKVIPASEALTSGLEVLLRNYGVKIYERKKR